MGIERRGRILVASLLTSLGVGGCSGCRAAFVTLPDGEGAFDFSPTGLHAALSRPQRVAFYDVDEKRIAWTRPIEEANVAVRFSPSGSYLAVFSSEDKATEGTLALVAAADGREIFRHSSPPPFALSASDDGELVARSDGLMSIAIEDRGGNVVHRQKIAGPPGGAIRKIAFAAGSTRLSIDAGGSVTVLDREGSRYLVTATLDGGYGSSFAGGGLFFGSANGIERWDGAKRSVVFGNDSTPGEGDLTADASKPRPPWLVAPDGLHLVIWNDMRFAVVSTSTGAIVFTQSQRSVSEGYVCDAAFAGPTLRIFLCSGELLDIDLAQGKTVKTRSFGAVGSTSPNFVYGSPSWSPSYEWALAPTGRYLRITRSGKHEVYLLE